MREDGKVLSLTSSLSVFELNKRDKGVGDLNLYNPLQTLFKACRKLERITCDRKSWRVRPIDFETVSYNWISLSAKRIVIGFKSSSELEALFVAIATPRDLKSILNIPIKLFMNVWWILQIKL